MTLLVGAAVGALALGLLPAIANAADPAGTAVTPPKPSTVTAARTPMVSDETGWIETDGATATVYTAASYAAHAVDSPDDFLSGAYQSAGGGYAVGFNTDTNALSAISFSTGHAISSSAAPLLATYDSLALVGTTGTEWVLSGQTLDTFTPTLILRPFGGGGDVVIPQPGGSVVFRQPLAAGPAGTLVQDSLSVDDGLGNVTNSVDIVLIAPGGGSTTTIASGLPELLNTFPAGAVSSTHVAWRTDAGFSLAPNGGGTSVAIPVAVESLDGLVVSKGVAFWTDYMAGAVRMTDSSAVVKTLVAPNPEAGLDVPRPSTLQNGTAAAVISASLGGTDSGSLTWFAYASTSQVAHLSGGFENLQLDRATESAGTAYLQYSPDVAAAPADRRTSPLFVRSIGGSPLAFGAESSVLSRASRFGFEVRIYRGSRFGDGFGFSGRRGAVPTWPSPTATSQELTLVDGLTRTSGVPIGKVISVSQSGPYTAFVRDTGSGGVALPDGTIVATLPAGLGHAEQDGPRVVYSTGSGEVWLRDVTKAASATNPRRLLTSCVTATVDCSRDYSVSGHRVAVTTAKDGVPQGAVDLFDVTTGAKTTLANVTGALTVRLRGNTLAYVRSIPDPDPNVEPQLVITFVDLTAGTPTPSVDTIVDTGGGFYSGRGYIGLDAHRIWWASPFALKTAAIPGSADTLSPPRLLGSTGARELYRVGAALSAPWTPTFDLDQSLTSAWTLTITSGATTVKTFTGAGTIGIRGISWDGKSTGGALVPNGTYTWTLTGSNADGSVVSSLGSGAATGTILVATPVASKVALRVAPATVTYGSAARLTATLLPSTGAAVAGQSVAFYGRAKGASAWTKVGTASTSSAGLATLSVKPSATWQYYATHPISAALLSSSSSTVSVAVAFKVSATWKASKVKKGKKVLVTGAVGPTVAGSVVIQRKSGKKWVKVVSTTLKAGRFSVKVKAPAKKGFVTYRVLKAADSGHLAGVSATKRIKVV